MRDERSETRRHARRGVATLVVLLLISVALAISYATMRSQATVVEIQHNSGLARDARQAAITGLTVALKKMHDADWAGVDSTLSASLGRGQGYSVTYTAGDPSLSEGDSDYADLPYRVTVLSTGYAADPGEPSRRTKHEARAVVRLVPRNLPVEPSDWWKMQQYVVYQFRQDGFDMDLPCQIAGPVRVQGPLRFALHYPNDADAWSKYLADLNRIQQNNGPDCRPLTGPVHLNYYSQETKYYMALQYELGVTTDHRALDEAGSDWFRPCGCGQYRVYEGGPVYSAQALPSSLENTALEPDPLANPLGLYYRSGSVELRNNVTVRGSLFASDDIRVVGTNVHFEPVELPALYGSDDPLRLPVATCWDFEVKASAGGSLTGLLAVFDDFDVEKGPESLEFAVAGKVILRRLQIREREPWNTLNWYDLYQQFETYCYEVSPAKPYFPAWMAARGRNPKPLVTMAGDPEKVRYHWKYDGDPIYVPHPDDASDLAPGQPGLRWDLLEWTDGL